MPHEMEPMGVAAQIEMEERAHKIRLQMLANHGFQESLATGIAADEADDMISLADLDRELGWNR